MEGDTQEHHRLPARWQMECLHSDCERMVEQSKHPSSTSVGIDMGIASFATFSDGTATAPKNAFRTYAKKLARLQRKLAKRVKFPANWRKLKARIAHLNKITANARKDFTHKHSAQQYVHYDKSNLDYGNVA